MTALYITLMILAVIMIIIFIPVDCVIDFSYNRDGTGLYIFLKYAFLKFKIVPSEEKTDKQKESKKEKEESKKEEKKENKKELFMLIKTVYDELRDKIFNLIGHVFRHTIRIKELNISSKLGTGNPMYTGIALGGANALIYNVISLAYRYTKLDKWNVSIDGDFDNTCIMAGVYAVIRTRVAYVIKIGIMAAILLLRIYLINRRIKKNGCK